jgi:hypothetical protein
MVSQLQEQSPENGSTKALKSARIEHRQRRHETRVSGAA